MSLSNLLFGKDPAAEGKPFYDQIPGMAQEYYQPKIDSGQQAGAQTQDIYQQMGNDPQAFMNALMSSYKPSEGYKYQQGLLTDAMSNTAAAGGYAGTPYDQRRQAEQTQGMLGQDMQQFLRNLLGVQGAGLGGMDEEAMRGQNAGDSLFGYQTGNMQQQGDAAVAAQQRKNDNWGALMGMLGGAGANMAQGMAAREDQQAASQIKPGFGQTAAAAPSPMSFAQLAKLFL